MAGDKPRSRRRFGGGALVEQAGTAGRALRSPGTERERLQALASFRVVDSDSEREYDGIAALAARLAGTRFASITFVDGRREWVKATAGAALPEVERALSFGGQVVASGAALVVEDAARDERFRTHPWVATEPRARFYAAVPVTSGALVVGAVAVLDPEPRPATGELLEALEEVVAVLKPHLERRREDAMAQNLTAVFGFDGRILRASPAFEAVLGWRPNEMVGRSTLEFVHRDDAERTRARIDRLTGGYRGGSGGFESRWRHRDGSYRWLLWNSDVVPHEKRFYSAAKDITDRKRDELALRESEARYRLLAENATDMITGHELDGTITYVSAAGQTLLGWRPDELVGRDAFEQIHPADRPSLIEAHRQMLERMHPTRAVYRLKRKDGGWVWVEGFARIVRDERSRPVGLQTTTRDITEMKEAVEALEAAREHFRRAFDDAPIGMCIITLERRIERVNSAFCEQIGYSADELVGRPPLELIHPDDRGDIDQAVREVMAGERGSFVLERRHLHKDGHPVWVRVTTSLMSAAPGEPARFLAHVEDITEQRRNADQLRRARQDAERANRAKSEFLSRMSHELRTPLNAVLGFAQVLEADDLSDEQRESVGRILRGGYHLLTLVNDVLDISAIEARQLPIAIEPVAAGAVVRETLDLMRSLADARSVEIHCDLPEPELVVCANAQRLKQVVMNLVSNAIKYGPEGGSVTIIVEPAGDECAAVRVIDEGPGIPSDQLERAFLPFERLGAAREVEGTGLGLPLSRNLVEAMGGSLSAETGAVGSTFAVDLPLAAGAPDEAAGRRPAAGAGDTRGAGGRRSQVLYIEDNASNVALVQRLFDRRDDLELHAASRGDAGLELARRLRPDAIVLDLHLPDTHGDDVLRVLRADGATSDVPVIVVTADITQEHEQRLLAAGATAYLTKPLDLGRFEAELERALARRPA